MDELRYEIDVPKRKGITLKEFKTLKEMDEFVSKFKDSDEIREYFINEINAYLQTKEAKEYFDMPSKKERNGNIVCYHAFPYKSRLVCALYDGNALMGRGIYTKLDESLNDINVLKEIYNDKFYLLRSQFLKDELYRIINFNGGKTAFKKEFISRIHKLDEDESYAYLRSLCETCDLLVKKREKKTVNVKVVNVSKIKGLSEYKLVKQTELEIVNSNINENEFQFIAYDDAPDYFKDIFYKAIENNDFDILFNLFSSEEIDLYSNYYKKGKVK